MRLQDNMDMANEHPVLPADMVLPTGLYFLALVPPPELQANIRGLQHRMAEEFGSKRALRSPPHITLQPPFSSTAHRIQALTQALAPWCAQRSGVDLSLRDFAAFAPRVVYIAVEHQPTLTTLQQALTQDFQAYFHGEPSADDRREMRRATHPFVPHITIGFRDLSIDRFRDAWAYFQTQTFRAKFIATHLTLLAHRDQGWHIHQQIPFG